MAEDRQAPDTFQARQSHRQTQTLRLPMRPTPTVQIPWDCQALEDPLRMQVGLEDNQPMDREAEPTMDRQ